MSKHSPEKLLKLFEFNEMVEFDIVAPGASIGENEAKTQSSNDKTGTIDVETTEF